MLLSANFACNVLPSMCPRPGPSPHQLWHQEMPLLDDVLTSPGALVSFHVSDTLSSTRNLGIYVRPAGRECQVFDLESRSLAFVPEIFLDVSAFASAVARSSPLISAVFGHPGSLSMAPLVGTPRFAGDGLGLFLDSWI